MNNNNFKGKIINVDHHLSHLCSSYFLSNFKKSIGLTIDGFGDFCSMESFLCEDRNIKKKEAVDKTALTESILRAVTRLASERAGTIIDDHPETFKNKIISFADKIEQLSTNLILNFNPVDADLLKKTLSKSLSDKKVEIKKNSELFRGDFIFQMGAIEIGDLLSEQILAAEKENEPTIQMGNSEIDSEKIEKKVVSEDIEATEGNKKESMAEIDDDKK